MRRLRAAVRAVRASAVHATLRRARRSSIYRCRFTCRVKAMQEYLLAHCQLPTRESGRLGFASALRPSVSIHTSDSRRQSRGQCTRYCTRYSQPPAKMKLAVCVLLAANGALALTPPKSAVAATRTGTALEAAAVPIAAAKEVSAVPRGGVIANFVGVDVALLSYFFFWYLGNYYCPRPRPNLRVGYGSTPPPRRQTLTRSPPRAQTTSRTSSRSRTRAAPRASP